MKKWLNGFFLSFVLALSIINVSGLSLNDLPQNNQYSVVGIQDGEIEVLRDYRSFSSAKKRYTNSLDDYDNVLIVKDGKVIQAEYGVVKIQSTAACDTNVEFKNALNEASNYTNGCYGADAAYLTTNSTGKSVQFKLSGVVGWASMNDVTIVPIEFLSSRLSTYVVKEENLYHQIKQNFESDFYSALINLGPAPSFLEEDKEYYSYDGHYFYTELKVMLDDYKENNYLNSVNQNNPYYNYYQYISHRSLTQVTQEEVRQYFEQELGIRGPIDTYRDLDKDSSNDTLSQSQFYNQQQSFYQYQYQYGANALMMLALSMNETAFGRSSLSFTRNNLFGHAAYDSDVEKNASRYFSVHSSIYSHAKYYISGSYSNPLRFQFHGSFFGNKSNGMNVSYASDPYWGEKAAQFYLKIDEAFDLKDYNAYTLGIKTSEEDVAIYLKPSDTSKVLYKTGIMPDFSFILLEEISNSEGAWYKVQSEATYDNEGMVDISYFYDYETNVGYIKQSDVQVVLNPEVMTEINWVDVKFDAAGGIFQDGTTEIEYKLESGKIAAMENPVKDNFLFTGWDQEFKPLESDTTYVAQYKEVDKIEIISYPKQAYEYNERIDLANGKIKVIFSDGTDREVNLTSSMVSGYDLKESKNQEVIITYGGKSISYPISVSQELDDIRQQLQEEIVLVIEEMGNADQLTEDQVERVLSLKRKMDDAMVPYLTQPQLRVLDKIIYKAIDHQIYYVIYANDLDASISGLSLSLPLGNSMEKKLLKDTYKLTVNPAITRTHFNQVKQIADGNGYEIHHGFTLGIEKNLKKIEIESPVIVSIKKPESSTVNQLFTVLLYQDGKVIKCYTKQTDDFIQFMAPSMGEFVVVSRNTTNDYVIENIQENVRVDNRDIDLPLLGSILLIVLTFLLAIIIILDWRLRAIKRKRNEKNRLLELEELEKNEGEK